MPSTTTPKPLSDVLYALALDERPLDAGVLDEYVRAHPQHAQELTAFAVELVLDNLACQKAESSAPSIDYTRQSGAVGSAVSRFHNRLYQASRAAAPIAAASSGTVPFVSNPIAALDRLGLAAFVDRLQINKLFAMKLRDRQIEPSTFPGRFVAAVAATLGVPPDVIIAHFNGPVVVQATPQSYMADQKPAVPPRQTFEDAVRTSKLTPEQQARLLTE